MVLTNRRRDYREGSPAWNAGKVSAPLLIQTNEQEFSIGLEYYGAPRANGAPAEVTVFPGEGHMFWQPRHQLIVQQRNID